MMKNLTKAALLLAAATAFLLAACSHSSGGSKDGEDGTPQRTLESISVTANENVKDHYNGDETEFDHTGLIVTAHYSDETDEDVTDTATFTATYKGEDGTEKEFPVTEKGIYEVTVTAYYAENTASLDEPIIITVGDVELKGISVSGTITKTSYKQGAALNYDGITVRAQYDVGEPVTLPNSSVTFTTTYKDGEAVKTFTTGLGPGEYSVTITAAYEGKTASLAAPVTITIEEKNTEDDYFMSFLASNLVKNSADTEITAMEADDGTWSIVTSKKLKAKPASISTYDGTVYTARLSAESSDVGSIKLKIGAGQKKILRVDAGNSKGDITEVEDGTIVVGGTTWAVQLAASTKYFEVTGGDDGYVTIDLKKNKSNIYAITVVDEVVNTSTIERTAEKVTYNAPVITLAETADANSPLTASVAAPTKTTTTYTAKADGVTAATTTNKNEQLTGITLTYAWSKGGEAIANGTDTTYTPTAGGVYTFTASYTAEDGKTYSASKSVTVKSSTTYTVTFNAGEGSFTNSTTTFSVHEGLTLKEEGFAPPTLTAPQGKVFTEWKSTPEGITIDDPITQAVTFTAQYGEKPAGTPINFDTTDDSTEMGKHLASLAKSANATDGTYDGVTFSNIKRANADVCYVEVNKNGTMSFPVAIGAKVVIAIGSTSNNNTTTYTITGGGFDNANATIAGTNFTEADLGTAKKDGTVTFSPTDRGLRIKTITVTY